jgi:hypothetical protein
LSPRLCLDLGDERREPTVGRRQAGSESRRSGADDDDVPVPQLVKLRVRAQFLDGEVGHVEFSSKPSDSRAALIGIIQGGTIELRTSGRP